MSNNIFPGQHVTTTTITSTETQVNPMIRFDRSYLNTLSGQLKLLEIISSCVAMFIVSFSRYHIYSVCTFFETVAVAAVWWNTILLIFYLFHVIEKFYKIPWLKVEIVSCVTFSALYFLAALLSLTCLFDSFLFFFFLLLVASGLMFVFAYDAYLKLQSLQSGEIPQSVRVVSQVTEVEAPNLRY